MIFGMVDPPGPTAGVTVAVEVSDKGVFCTSEKEMANLLCWFVIVLVFNNFTEQNTYQSSK